MARDQEIYYLPSSEYININTTRLIFGSHLLTSHKRNRPCCCWVEAVEAFTKRVVSQSGVEAIIWSGRHPPGAVSVHNT